MSDDLASLIHRVDLDGLVRYVDNTCANRDWDHLIHIRNDARSAVNTGRQLWPIATLANYRLALYAPAHLAVRSFDDTARTFMPGPLSEIISVHHTWSELEPHLPDGPDRSLVAYERALRGDNITTDETYALDIPLTPESWEPTYPLATYDDDGAHCDPPLIPEPTQMLPPPSQQDLSDAEEKIIDDDETTNAVREIFSSWTTESNGFLTVSVVEGSVHDALYAYKIEHAELVELSTAQAFALISWAGASGGAHGSRRGMATGRFSAWWLCAALTDTIDDWPLSASESAQAFTALQWCQFQGANDDDTGWNVQLVAHDPSHNISVCMSAHDTAS